MGNIWGGGGDPPPPAMEYYPPPDYSRRFEPAGAAPKPGAPRPLRLLCLHGRGSNNDITFLQLVNAGLPALGASCDLFQVRLGCCVPARMRAFVEHSSEWWWCWGERVYFVSAVNSGSRSGLEVGAKAAISSGSSPTSAALWSRSTTCTGPSRRPP